MNVKIKVLWFCNAAFSDAKPNATGTWLYAMANALVDTRAIQLYNITQANVKCVTRIDYQSICQWFVPFESLENGLPCSKTIKEIQGIVNDIKPDVIHIWGTESYWGLLTARKIIKGYKIILDMQGLMIKCAEVFYGGLTFNELLHCIEFKDLVLPHRSLFAKKMGYKKWGRFEIEMIRNHCNISTQSNWIQAQIEAINSDCNLFRTGIVIRNEFYTAQPWISKNVYNRNAPIIFTYSSDFTSYKGLHLLFRALALLKHKFPSIVLKIAGEHRQKRVSQPGYYRWLINEARSLGIDNSIQWLGSLDATRIIEQFYISSAVIIPSYVESYSLAFAEAMIVGVPTVVSFAGAMPELAKHEESALYFPVGDEMMCAYQTEKILMNREMAESISFNARKIALTRNNVEKVVKHQIQIYNEVLN